MQRNTSANNYALMAAEAVLFLLGMILLTFGTVDDRFALMRIGAIMMSVALVWNGVRTVQTSTHPWLRRVGQLEVVAGTVLLVSWFISFVR